MWAHVVIGSALLVALVPFVGPSEIWTSDEGAVRAQVGFVASEGDWSRTRPFAEIDPEMVLSPIKAATINGDAYFPYTKRPAYPSLLVPLRAVFGESALIWPSLAGAVAAAIAGSMVVGLFSSAYRRTTFWTLAFASPLLFYAFTVTAHTVAAACAGFAFVASLRTECRLITRVSVAVALVVLAVLLRAEAAIYGISLSIALIAVWSRDRDRRHLITAGGVGLATIAAHAANSSWALGIAGVEPVSEGERILSGMRILTGAFSSLLLIGHQIPLGSLAAAAVAVGGSVLLAITVRHESENRGMQLIFAGVSVFAVAALLMLPPVAISGFLIATPTLIVGLTLVRWRELDQPVIWATLVLLVVFAAGVMGTQEGGGGGLQWGGRYLMLIVPLAVPGAVVAINRQSGRTPSCRTVLVVVVVMVSAGMSINGVLLLNRQHARAVPFQTEVIALAEAVADATGDPPVIVSTNPHLGRHLWREIERIDFLLPPTEEFVRYMERFAATDARRFGFVGNIETHESLFAAIGFRIEIRTGPRLAVFERVGDP